MSLFETLSRTVPTFPPAWPAPALVVGDVMPDRYWFGEVNRISPEAPVPVAKITCIEERGRRRGQCGAQYRRPGRPGQPAVRGGDDEAASALETPAAARRHRHRCACDPSISTTTKLRVVARQQQLIRIDFEEAPATKPGRQAGRLCRPPGAARRGDFVRLRQGGLTHVARMVELARAAGAGADRPWATTGANTPAPPCSPQ